MTSLKKTRLVLSVFISLLIISGITAFPVRTEIEFLNRHIQSFPIFIQSWISHLSEAVRSTPDVILYGTDWLAFAHIVIALFFIPVLIDPVRYKYNIIAGIVACLAVFPLAFICGPLRGIPFFHQLIDCSFGAGGGLMLYFIYKKIAALEHAGAHSKII